MSLSGQCKLCIRNIINRTHNLAQLSKSPNLALNSRLEVLLLATFLFCAGWLSWLLQGKGTQMLCVILLAAVGSNHAILLWARNPPCWPPHFHRVQPFHRTQQVSFLPFFSKQSTVWCCWQQLSAMRKTKAIESFKVKKVVSMNLSIISIIRQNRMDSLTWHDSDSASCLKKWTGGRTCKPSMNKDAQNAWQ